MSAGRSGIIDSDVAKPILVLGDDVTLVPCIAAVLAADSAIECVIATSDPERMGELATGAGVAVRARDALPSLLSDAFAVVNLAGPFIAGEYPVARECARRGVHYVDIACGREYVAGINVLNRRAQANGSLVVAGAGVSPAISAALIDSLAPDFDQIQEIDVTVALPERGAASALRPWVGCTMQLKRGGRWREAYGWSEPTAVMFPAPLARRRAYLCDAADLAILPQRYHAQTVNFRASLGRGLVPRALALLARMRHGRRAPAAPLANGAPSDEGLQRLLQSASAIHIRVRGRRAQQLRALSVCLLARSDGRVPISASPVVALVRRWAHAGVDSVGAQPCVGLLDLEALKAELLDEDVVLVRS